MKRSKIMKILATCLLIAGIALCGIGGTMVAKEMVNRSQGIPADAFWSDEIEIKDVTESSTDATSDAPSDETSTEDAEKTTDDTEKSTEDVENATEADDVNTSESEEGADHE